MLIIGLLVALVAGAVLVLTPDGVAARAVGSMMLSVGLMLCLAAWQEHRQVDFHERCAAVGGVVNSVGLLAWECSDPHSRAVLFT